MEFNNWYESSNAPQYSPAPRQQKKKRRGISAVALIACMLATALLGGIGGAYFGAGLLAERAAQTASAPADTDAGGKEAVSEDASASESEAGTSAQALSSALTVSSDAAAGLTRAQVVELCAPSVVGIDVVAQSTASYGFFGSQTYATEGSGSGIIVTSDGYIITCLHVVENASSITVITNDDVEYKATLIGSDSRYDLAVIKIDAAGLTPATLGDSDMVTVGEDVIAIGNPLGELRGTATGGWISAVNRTVTVEGQTMTLLQTDAAISPGNSGGGLFNSSGTLIGIVNAKASDEDAEGLGFAIPVNSVKQVISDLVDLGYVTGRAYLGVYTQNVTRSSGHNGLGGYYGGYYSSGTYCVQVEQVVSGSAAEAAGIEAGDLILAVGDTQISSNDDLSSAIGEYDAGDTAILTVQRDGEQHTVEVTFGEYIPQ